VEFGKNKTNPSRKENGPHGQYFFGRASSDEVKNKMKVKVVAPPAPYLVYQKNDAGTSKFYLRALPGGLVASWCIFILIMNLLDHRNIATTNKTRLLKITFDLAGAKIRVWKAPLKSEQGGLTARNGMAETHAAAWLRHTQGLRWWHKQQLFLSRIAEGISDSNTCY
jgi:hypothetical protein